MRKINWGIIGTGNIAHSFARDFVYVNHGKLVAVASRSLDKAKDFADEFNISKAFGSYAEMYNSNEIDAVYIATPHNAHLQNSTDALKASKAVLCEKPIAINPNECNRLMDIAKSTGNYLMEAMWTYFLPAIVEAQKWIEDGKIGKIKYIKADFGFKANIKSETRLFDPKFAGGALLDIGIYPIAMAWLIYKQTPEKVSVFSKQTNTGVDSEETMIFEYANGEVANLAASILYNMPNEAIIMGDKGMLRIPDFFMAKECFLYENGDLKEHFTDPSKCVGYNYEVDAVSLDLLEGKKESAVVPLHTSLKIQELMEIVKRSFNLHNAGNNC